MEGYKLGWLDFNYNNPLSRLREQFLLSEIEKKIYKETLYLRAVVDASIISTAVTNNKKLIELPYGSVETYTQLALPYLVKKSNIKEVMTDDKMKQWASDFKAKRAKFEEQQKNKNTK